MLVDTNIWLEQLLEQDRAAEVGAFCGRTPSSSLSITDFSLFSIGIILTKLGKAAEFGIFVQELFLEGAVTLLRLAPSDLSDVLAVMDRFSLDFDDAYQYAAAELHDLRTISFDGDFDRTDRGRLEPGQAVSP